MYSRLFQPPAQSYFLFGPRGVGKSFWLRQQYPQDAYIDLLDAANYARLQADPTRLEGMIGDGAGPVVIDEIQRIPELLNEVHRLIEARGIRFMLTGSSARSLRRRGVNLLAGRALTRHLHPLVLQELGDDFDIQRYLRQGGLPAAWSRPEPADFLKAYVGTYLREEVLQEGITRNLGAFYRFLEAASFSQAQLLNISAVARDCSVERKMVESYFQVLEDLLLGARIAPFTRPAKRPVVVHPKFYFVDCGIYQTIRPRGPLDVQEEIDGAALETMVFQHVRAWNDYSGNPFSIHFWRSRAGEEVDLVLYGETGLHAIEVKRTGHLRAGDFEGLRAFKDEYPPATLGMVYGGEQVEVVDGVRCQPADAAFVSEPGQAVDPVLLV